MPNSAPEVAIELVRRGEVQMIRDARTYAVGPLESRVLVTYSDTAGAKCSCGATDVCFHLLAVLLVEQQEAGALSDGVI